MRITYEVDLLDDIHNGYIEEYYYMRDEERDEVGTLDLMLLELRVNHFAGGIIC